MSVLDDFSSAIELARSIYYKRIEVNFNGQEKGREEKEKITPGGLTMGDYDEDYEDYVDDDD